MLGTKFEDVRDQSHALLRWEHVSATSDVFLQNVILNGAFQFLHARTLLFCSNDVHGQQNHGRRVDGHRRADLVERNVVKEDFHVLNG